MKTSRRLGVWAWGWMGGLVLPATALGQTAATPGAGEVESVVVESREVKFSVAGGIEHLFGTQTDAGGDFNITRFNAGLAAQTDLTGDLDLALRLNYAMDTYDFEGGTTFGSAVPGGDPWENIHTLSAGAIFSLDASDKWTLFGGPVVQSAREEGADWSEGLTGGGVLGATYRCSNNLTLGGGVVVTSQIEDSVRVSPLIIVNWQISNDLRLSSQTTASASGRSGLELIYDAGGGLEFAMGGANQFSRFRLDEEGIAPDGVGQDESFPIWLRASYDVSKQFRLDAIGGINTGGELRVEDSDGDRIATQDYDIAPFVGLFASLRF